MSITVTCYVSSRRPEEAEIREELAALVKSLDGILVEISIEEDAELLRQFSGKTPVLRSGPFTLTYPFTISDAEVMIRTAAQRASTLSDEKDPTYTRRALRSQSITRGDRFGLWISHNYVWAILLLLIVFLGLPFLAPVLAKNGNDGMASAIYTIYKPLCHQLAFRSYFLFGEQAYYPRELAHLSGLLTYEQISGSSLIDVQQARDFIGNALVGYKVGLCERDVAIYGSVILFGFLFQLTGRKMKQIHWAFWILIALVPIGLDGFSQLPGMMVNPPAWMPIRESTPLLRTITGALFGFFSAWFVFPLFEESVSTTRVELLRKIAIVNKIEGRV